MQFLLPRAKLRQEAQKMSKRLSNYSKRRMFSRLTITEMHWAITTHDIPHQHPRIVILTNYLIIFITDFSQWSCTKIRIFCTTTLVNLRKCITILKTSLWKNIWTILHFFVCVGVMYSGEYDVCDVTLSVHPHWASWKVCLATVGIEPATFVNPMLCHISELSLSRGFDSHHGQANFSACPVWMHTQSNITNIIFT
jgi:hypothetical protein